MLTEDDFQAMAGRYRARCQTHKFLYHRFNAAAFGYRTFLSPHDPLELVGFILIDLPDIDFKNPHLFSRTGVGYPVFRKNAIGPLFQIFLTRIPFDNIADFLGFCQSGASLKGVTS